MVTVTNDLAQVLFKSVDSFSSSQMINSSKYLLKMTNGSNLRKIHYLSVSPLTLKTSPHFCWATLPASVIVFWSSAWIQGGKKTKAGCIPRLISPLSCLHFKSIASPSPFCRAQMYAVAHMGLDMLTLSSSVYDRQVTVKIEGKNTLECMFGLY